MNSNEIIGLFGFVVLVSLVILGTPIGFAFLFTGLAGLLVLRGLEATSGFASFGLFASVNSTTLTVLPLFVLMGNFIVVTGIARELFDTASKWFGRFRGGLAYATIVGAFGFGAISGSSVASAATFGRIALPEMRAKGYNDRLAAGTVAAGGTLAILVPPSITAVLYGIITETPIGKVLLAGFIPGALAAFAYFAAIFIQVRLNPKLAPASVVAVTWRERVVSLRGVTLPMLLMLLVMGTIYAGIATPTEAAAIGAGGAFILLVFRKQFSRKTMADSVKGTMSATVMVLTILVGASVFTVFLTLSGVTQLLATNLLGAGLTPLQFYLALIVLYLFLGMFFDPLPMMLLTLPFIFPAVKHMGWSPVWFGIFIIRMAEIGLLTPPLGMNVYVLKGVAPTVKLNDIWIGIVPFVIADVFTLAILYMFPDVALFLPNLMK